MANTYFVISFSLKYDDTYNDRRSSMLAAIRRHGATYEDTTSFIMLKTDSKIEDVKSSMTYSQFDSTKDRFVIVQCFSSTFLKGGKANPLKFT